MTNSPFQSQVTQEAHQVVLAAVPSRDGTEWFVDTTYVTTAALDLLICCAAVELFEGRVHQLTRAGIAVREVLTS